MSELCEAGSWTVKCVSEDSSWGGCDRVMSCEMACTLRCNEAIGIQERSIMTSSQRQFQKRIDWCLLMFDY
jgi:hypothetical protein